MPSLRGRETLAAASSFFGAASPLGRCRSSVHRAVLDLRQRQACLGDDHPRASLEFVISVERKEARVRRAIDQRLSEVENTKRPRARVSFEQIEKPLAKTLQVFCVLMLVTCILRFDRRFEGND